MMDLSDGLRRDLPRVALASGVAVDLKRERLEDVAAPGIIEWSRSEGHDPHDFVLQSGEDFALLATFPPGTELPGCYTPIGRIVGEEAVGTVLLDGRPLATGGWDHFS